MQCANERTRRMKPQQHAPPADQPGRVENEQAPVASPVSAEELEPEGPPSLLAEFKWFLLENKKWWMIPLILVFLVLASLVFLGGTPFAVFIYPIF
jgi:hypothetical protein